MKKHQTHRASRLLFPILLILGLTACGGGSDGGTTPATPIDLWTWMSGSDVANQAGVYGTQGTAADTNVPGARLASVSWTDSSGNLWLFGGWGYDSAGALGNLNDLWKYDTSNWTWVSGSNVVNQAGVYGTKGIATGANVPGGRRNPVSWMDSSGNLWLFGGSGYDSAGNPGMLNDLWKYDGTNWTWVSGSDVRNQSGVYGTKGTAAGTNVPGGRTGAVSWIDSSGNLWLFGGYGWGSAGTWGELNDLWKYDGTNWTWVSGSNVADQAGVYGTKGTAAGTNVPGGRSSAVSWIDSGGNLWLFGGYGWDSAGTRNLLNDLWKYDGSNWTWVSGSDVVNQPAVYGTKGTSAGTNVPGARYGSTSWTDSGGNLWLFGGDTSDCGPNLNDLWKYDGVNWTWVSGSNVTNQAGDYGTKGTALNTNVPGGRGKNNSWIDSSSNLWLFGGCGVDSSGTTGYLNDLWRYQP